MFLHFFRKKKIIQDSIKWRYVYWLVSIITIHTLLIAKVENLPLLDSFWFTMTTALTVGFGDIAPKTDIGRLITMSLMYVGVIFFITKFVSDWFEILATRTEKKLKGLWRYKMKNHIVIIGHPEKHPEIFISKLVKEISKDERFHHKEVVVVSQQLDSLPSELDDLGIKFVKGELNQINVLEKANILQADVVYLISHNSHETFFDSYALDIIDLLRHHDSKAYIITECVNQSNDVRLKKHGANAVIRVLHGYPNFASRALTVQRSEEIMSNMFNDEKEECIRIDLQEMKKLSWKEIVLNCIDKEMGTPIAVIDEQGKILTSPIGQTMNVQSIFMISTKQYESNTISMKWP